MKILISAYSCEPNKGSEPQVGWDHLLNYLGKDNEVHLITRKNNFQSINKIIGTKQKLKIITFDLPEIILKLKKNIKSFLVIYIFLWELFAIFKIFKHYGFNKFDLVHKSTMLSYKYINFLSLYGKSSIIGPVAGAETYPISFLKNFTLKGKFIEIIRYIFLKITIYNPINIFMLLSYNKIYCANQDTIDAMPFLLKPKCFLKKAIKVTKKDFEIPDDINRESNLLNILYVGRVIELKGLIMVLKALKQLDTEKYLFTIIGDGNDTNRLKKYSKNNNLNVKFIGYVKRNELSMYYSNCDLFIFPSLHDSSGYSVLEAKLFNKKIICTKFGGPKHYVDNRDYVLLSSNYTELIDELKNTIEQNIA